VPVSVHRECLPGHVFGSPGCGCGERLRAALERLAAEDRGVVVYLGADDRGLGCLGDVEDVDPAQMADAGDEAPPPSPAAHLRRIDGELVSAVLQRLGVAEPQLSERSWTDAR
jgi:3,4-dihydroxy 2-butanone 4-phosphate synthase/GTP cyclohydrolase II